VRPKWLRVVRRLPGYPTSEGDVGGRCRRHLCASLPLLIRLPCTLAHSVTHRGVPVAAVDIRAGVRLRARARFAPSTYFHQGATCTRAAACFCRRDLCFACVELTELVSEMMWRLVRAHRQHQKCQCCHDGERPSGGASQALAAATCVRVAWRRPVAASVVTHASLPNSPPVGALTAC
jgi:hypothetical protein